MTSIEEVLAGLGPEPVTIAAPATALRKHIKDPSVVIAPHKYGQSLISRPSLVHKLASRAEADGIYLDTDVPLPERNPLKLSIYPKLAALPLDQKTSIFVANRTAGTMSSVMRRASERNGHIYTTHQCVRDGVAGVRIWRKS